jgi:3-oxoacyl-[acyl-carrier-protein] synthase-3
MAVTAARRALDDAGLAASEIDDIRVGVNTWLRFPSLGTQIQKALGCRKASASDVSAGCAGFVYAVEEAYNRMWVEQVRYRRPTRALVVGVDGLSHITDWSDRHTCVLLGDGAGAVVMADDADNEILALDTRADGRYGDLLYSAPVIGNQLNGGPDVSFTNASEGPRTYLRMDGPRTYAIAVRTMARNVRGVVQKYNQATDSSVSLEDIGYVFPHQANLRIIEAVASRLGLSMDHVYSEGVKRYGNTSTASIPMGYAHARDRCGDGAGSRFEVDVAFGAGFASGAILRRVRHP